MKLFFQKVILLNLEYVCLLNFHAIVHIPSQTLIKGRKKKTLIVEIKSSSICCHLRYVLYVSSPKVMHI